MTPSPRPALVAALLLTAILGGGCAGGDAAAPGPAPTPRAFPASDDRALTVDGGGGSNGLCLFRVRSPEDLAVFDDYLVASTPLTVTGVRAVGEGHVLGIPGGLVAPVVGRRPHGSGVVTWPVRRLPFRSMAKSVDWASRTALVGAHLDVQRAVLAFIHVRGGPGARLKAIEFSYRTDAGKLGTVRVARKIRFNRGRCA